MPVSWSLSLSPSQLLCLLIQFVLLALWLAYDQQLNPAKSPNQTPISTLECGQTALMPWPRRKWPVVLITGHGHCWWPHSLKSEMSSIWNNQRLDSWPGVNRHELFEGVVSRCREKIWCRCLQESLVIRWSTVGGGLNQRATMCFNSTIMVVWKPYHHHHQSSSSSSSPVIIITTSHPWMEAATTRSLHTLLLYSRSRSISATFHLAITDHSKKCGYPWVSHSNLSEPYQWPSDKL